MVKKLKKRGAQTGDKRGDVAAKGMRGCVSQRVRPRPRSAPPKMEGRRLTGHVTSPEKLHRGAVAPYWIIAAWIGIPSSGAFPLPSHPQAGRARPRPPRRGRARAAPGRRGRRRARPGGRGTAAAQRARARRNGRGGEKWSPSRPLKKMHRGALAPY